MSNKFVDIHGARAITSLKPTHVFNADTLKHNMAKAYTVLGNLNKKTDFPYVETNTLQVMGILKEIAVADGFDIEGSAIGVDKDILDIMTRTIDLCGQSPTIAPTNDPSLVSSNERKSKRYITELRARLTTPALSVSIPDVTSITRWMHIVDEVAEPRNGGPIAIALMTTLILNSLDEI